MQGRGGHSAAPFRYPDRMSEQPDVTAPEGVSPAVADLLGGYPEGEPDRALEGWLAEGAEDA